MSTFLPSELLSELVVPDTPTGLSGETVNPFSGELNPLAAVAAANLQRDLQARLESLTARLDSQATSPQGQTGPLTSDASAVPQEGKMFGVLVVKWNNGLRYLSGFSGKLSGDWLVDGFVPPPFDTVEIAALLALADTELKQLDVQITHRVSGTSINALKQQLVKSQTSFENRYNALVKQHAEKKLKRREARDALQQASDNQGSPVSVEKNGVFARMSELSAQSQSDRHYRREWKRRESAVLDSLERQIRDIENSIRELREQRKNKSRQFQQKYFSLFNIVDRDGASVNVNTLYADKMPASGTGECAGAKLLAYAYRHNLQPVAMAEFWWGAAPPGEIRHHGQFYPSCRGKCGVLLPVMLKTPQNKVQHAPVDNDSPVRCRARNTSRKEGAGGTTNIDDILIRYEDEWLAVVEKPPGLLSVPGKSALPTLLDWAVQRWPNATGPLLVHRLDMDTSGLLLVAKNKNVHRHLQHQFEQRRVHKTYHALLIKRPAVPAGEVSLPLRVDLDDRPRQMVCFEHGKAALTRFRLLDGALGQSGQSRQRLAGNNGWDNACRIEFEPLTGRTHQLRIHAASASGLDAPIMGDPLYGRSDEINPSLLGKTGNSPSDFGPSRMMLHACRLKLQHPVSGNELVVTSDTPF